MKEENLSVDAEQEAGQALEELRATLYSIGDGVIVTDAACRITRINPVAESLTGWSEVETFGKPLDDVFRIVNEKSRAEVKNPAERVLREGKTVGLANDTLLIARDGTERPIADCGAPIFDRQGTIIGVVLVFHDQTAERAAQRALKESEELHRITIENILDPVFITDSEGKFTFICPNIPHILGYSVEEIRALGNISACVGEGRSLFDLEDLNRRGEISNIEAVIANKNGAKRDYLVTVKRVSIKGGTILYVCRDITERKQAEEEHKAHVRFLENLERVDLAIKQEINVEKMLWNIVETVFSIFDCDRAWLFYPGDPEAPSFRVPVEISRPEYPGANVQDLDVPMTPDLAENLREVLESDDPVTYTAGTERPINQVTAEQFGVQSQMTVPLYPKLGKPWVFGMHQCSYPRLWSNEEKKLFKEISRRIADGLSSVLFLRELQENEERFRATFEQAAVGIAHVAPDGRWLRVNQKLCEIVGYSRQELLQKTFQDITYPEDLDADLENVRQVLAGEIPTYSMEKRYLRKDGSLVWINLTVSMVRNASGDPAYFISVIEGIGQRKKAEEEKEILQGQLLQAQKMESVGRLAGGVAHDFNNMLGVILGHAELALEQVDPAQPLHADLEEIRKAGQRAADLTRQLLAFARKQTVSPKVLDLNDMVAGMLSMLRRLIGEDIDLAWLPGIELWPVKMDPSQIDQILANLCVNARDACAGVGKVTIETKNMAFDEVYCTLHKDFIPGEYAELAVSDNGSGMGKEVLENLFEPFFTTKGMGKGTGLGLSTVYGIVKQNKGFINVSSDPGEGTTIRIYLPRFMGKNEGISTEDQSRKAAGGPETILLVEDEATMLDLTRTMLERLGYRVLTAGTPGEAIELAEEHAGEIDLVVTDVVMPEMTGSDLCKRLLSLYPDLKRLFMSGYTANVIAHYGILEEGVCFIQKPFSLMDLSFKVRETLGKKEGAEGTDNVQPTKENLIGRER
ncbi:MAG: PAS domain S-box protein [Deltaproteobacteria bacterium]|nr:PAS domain S-box protein [Deltaproteobacteria bacterium]